jgi:hypothetical protein
MGGARGTGAPAAVRAVRPAAARAPSRLAAARRPPLLRATTRTGPSAPAPPSRGRRGVRRSPLRPLPPSHATTPVHVTDGRDRPARLTAAQRAALRHADTVARSRAADAPERLARVLRAAACPADAIDDAARGIRAGARVVVHFHPDRYGRGPLPVAESLLADGRYRSQFETGLSSGSRTAFAGGLRDGWERELFGGAYHEPGVLAEERPKYGALELIRHPDGPVPRFGSCYLVLRSAVAERSTFTFGGSEQAGAPERFGTLTAPHPVLAALFEEVAAGATTPVPWPPFVAPTLGVPGLTVAELLARLARDLPAGRPEPSVGAPGRVLDSCVEAHVHGPIDLRRDVELLVIDPAFDGTPTGEALAELGRRYEVPMRRHRGFRLRTEDVPDDFRGPAMPPLARRIAADGWLDAAVIGAAEASLHRRPEEWRDRGSTEETLQHLKQLWHILVHYGSPS